MSEVDVALARQYMGTALGDWVASPEMLHQVSPTSWYFLSGLPSFGFNKTMVNADDEDTLSKVLKIIDEKAAPTNLFLAAEGKNLVNRLSAEWKRVRDDPFMYKYLNGKDQEFDSRVSLASIDDFKTILTLLSDSFGVEPNRDSIIANILKNPVVVSDIWVLKEGGEAVSTVMTCPVDDALTVWAMGTPPQFRRRGYGKALLDDVLARSSSKGATIGLLVATKAGKELYDASGWATLEEWDVYAKDAAIHQ